MTKDQAERLKIGDVLYYVERNGHQAYPYFGLFGYYDDFGENISIDLVELFEHRFISSEYVEPTPIDEFHTEETWHRLPKDWTYNTELFQIEDRTPEWKIRRRDELKITNPEDVRTALTERIIGLARTKYHGSVEAEIDRHKGWRIKKEYPAWWMTYGEPNPNYRSAGIKDVFSSYQEAFDRCNEIKSEWEAEAALSDEEWSKKEIEKVLQFFPEEQSGAYRRILFSMPDIDDLEVKKGASGLMYRYFSKHGDWIPVTKGIVKC